jgi:hypothetical protein
LLRVDNESFYDAMFKELILIKKQLKSGFSYDLEDERLDKLLREAVLWLFFLVRRFEPTDDSTADVSSRKLLSEISEIDEIPFFSIVICLLAFFENYYKSLWNIKFSTSHVRHFPSI